MRVAAIVQQGELGAIIHYTPKQLKELLNSLIGIDKLDYAFQSMRDALEGFRLNLRTECMNYDDQSVDALQEEIGSTIQKQQEGEARAKEASTKLEGLRQEQESLEAELTRLEPLRRKKDEYEERKEELIRYVGRKISELAKEADALSEVASKAKSYLPVIGSKEQVESEGIDLEEKEQALNKARTDLTSDLRSSKAAAERVKRLQLETKQGAKEIEKVVARVQKVRAEVRKLKSVPLPTKEAAEQLAHRLKESESSLDGLKEDLTKLGETIASYKTIQKTGICPTCQSTVKEINLDAKLAIKHKQHTEARSKYDSALQRRDSTRALLDERKKYDTAQKRLKEQTDLLEEYTSDLKTERKKFAAARDEIREKSAEAKREPTLRRKLESVQTALSDLDENKRLLRKKRDSLVEAETWLRQNKIATQADIEERQKLLEDLRAKLRSVPKDLASASVKALTVDEYSSEQVGKMTDLQKEAGKFDEDAYQSIKKELEGRLRPDINNMTGDLGGWRKQASEAGQRLSQLKQVRTKLEDARRYTNIFQKIRDDVYNRDGILATSLRSWALRELSRDMSDYVRSFGIGLSEVQLKEQKHDVNIECYSSSGMADIKSMSGGESVAIALALRFAMARLMGKGTVDFIALDEPTTHLDEERRRSLVRLITEFNSDERRTLSQIIVITHDREIFEDSEVNAVFQFEKTPDGTVVTKS